MRYLAVALLLCLPGLSVGIAQPLPAPTATIREQVNQIPIGDKLTVRKLDGTEYHGRLQAVDAQTFSLREVDLKTIVTVPYAEVDRVTKDYGGKGFGGQRVNPHRARIIGIVLVGALLMIVAVALVADKS